MVLLALGLAGGGCAGLDRERYSLVFRRRAHQYRELSPAEQEELRLFERTRLTAAQGFVARVAYQPFRPFAYCRRHRSRHLLESFTAFLAAPVEMPATVGTYMGSMTVKALPQVIPGLLRGVRDTFVGLVHALLPARRPPPVSTEEHPGEARDR